MPARRGPAALHPNRAPPGGPRPGGGRGALAARALAALALATGVTPVRGADDRAQKACETVEYRVNALAGFTATFCTPYGGKRQGAFSLFVLSQATVLGDEDKRRLWLVVAVAAVGSVLNEDPSLPVEDLSLSDSQTIARERLAFALPASLAKQLQDRLRRGQIDEAAMYREIERNLRKEPARKGATPPRSSQAPGGGPR